MVIIIWISNILALSIPDEGYSRNMSFSLMLISTFFNIFVDLYKEHMKKNMEK